MHFVEWKEMIQISLGFLMTVDNKLAFFSGTGGGGGGGGGVSKTSVSS